MVEFGLLLLTVLILRAFYAWGARNAHKTYYCKGYRKGYENGKRDCSKNFDYQDYDTKFLSSMKVKL